MTNVKRIESYGLFDFCKDIEAALTEGYVFDFDTNENFPTAYGSMFTCGLVKASEEVETEEVTETETEEVEVVVEVAPELSEIVAQIEQVGEVENNEQQDETETQETTEEATQVKRGPKAKNK
jgi:hypothetical protein